MAGLGNSMGSRAIVDLSSPNVSPVFVTFSFATAPRSPAEIESTGICSFPWMLNSCPIRSRSLWATLKILESEFTFPEYTRKNVNRPA